MLFNCSFTFSNDNVFNYNTQSPFPVCGNVTAQSVPTVSVAGLTVIVKIM